MNTRSVMVLVGLAAGALTVRGAQTTVFSDAFPKSIYANWQSVSANTADPGGVSWTRVLSFSNVLDSAYTDVLVPNDNGTGSGGDGAVAVYSGNSGFGVMLYDDHGLAELPIFDAQVDIEGSGVDQRGGLAFHWQPMADTNENVSGYLFEFYNGDPNSSGAEAAVRLLKYEEVDGGTEGLAPLLTAPGVSELLSWTDLAGFDTVGDTLNHDTNAVTLGVTSDGSGTFVLTAVQGTNDWTQTVADSGTVLSGGYLGMATQRGNGPDEDHDNYGGVRFDNFACEMTLSAPPPVQPTYSNDFNEPNPYTRWDFLADVDADWTRGVNGDDTDVGDTYFEGTRNHTLGGTPTNTTYDGAIIQIGSGANAFCHTLYDARPCGRVYAVQADIETLGHGNGGAAGLALNWQPLGGNAGTFSGYALNVTSDADFTDGAGMAIRFVKYVNASDAVTSDSCGNDTVLIDWTPLREFTAVRTSSVWDGVGDDNGTRERVTLYARREGNVFTLYATDGVRRWVEEVTDTDAVNGGYVGMIVERGFDGSLQEMPAGFDNFEAEIPPRGSVLVVR
ncbi:MAG: hypothetical protein JW951_02460 [Lentisphaerae bacterium]|nr:hypothetical protein [Lentisphaerota bacterium]